MRVLSNCFIIKFDDFNLIQVNMTETIQSHTRFCICCLEKNSGLIYLANCSHSDYLNNFTIPNLKPHDQMVCYQCHSVLKKIKDFEFRVQESLRILSSKTFNLEINLKPARLKTENTLNISIHQNEDMHSPQVTKIMKSENEDSQNLKLEKKIKNMQTALDIIESNNSVPLLGLLSGIKNLGNDILRTVLSEGLKVKNFDTPLSTGGYVKTDDYDATSHTSAKPSQKKSKRSHPIRKVKLTKKQLMRERYIQTRAKDYLKYPYKCKNCIQGFTYEENLEDHMARKHDAKLGSICEICTQVHPFGTLDVHMRRHFFRYMCVDCLKKFSSRDDAVYHYAKQHEMRYKCEICGYVLEDLKKMRNHRMKMHRFSCEQCGVVFATSRRLHRHVMVKHKNKSKESSQDTSRPDFHQEIEAIQSYGITSDMKLESTQTYSQPQETYAMTQDNIR